MLQAIAGNSGGAPAANEVYVIYEPDASEHALRLQAAMDATLKQACNVSVPDELVSIRSNVEVRASRVTRASIEDLGEHLEGVAGSKYLLLVQTAGVLAQPWTLLALYYAHIHSIPIVCVVVQGSDYDFVAAKAHLEHLRKHLDEASFAAMNTVLGRLEPPAHMRALQSTLAALIPSLISVVYNPRGSDHELAATVRDVRDKHLALCQVSSDPARRVNKLPTFADFTLSARDADGDDVSLELAKSSQRTRRHRVVRERSSWSGLQSIQSLSNNASECSSFGRRVVFGNRSERSSVSSPSSTRNSVISIVEPSASQSVLMARQQRYNRTIEGTTGGSSPASPAARRLRLRRGTQEPEPPFEAQSTSVSAEWSRSSFDATQALPTVAESDTLSHTRYSTTGCV